MPSDTIEPHPDSEFPHIPYLAETPMTDIPDTSAEAVERLAKQVAMWHGQKMVYGRQTLAARHGYGEWSHSSEDYARNHWREYTSVVDAMILPLVAERDAAVARAEAAERRVAEMSLYRTIVSAWLAGRGLIPELDAHMAALPEGDRPADPERDALVAVARAARVQREAAVAVSALIGHRPGPERKATAMELGAANRALWSAIDALPPGVLDQSSG